MNILDAIVEQKRVEVLGRKQTCPLSNLGSFESYRRKTNVIRLPEPGEKPVLELFPELSELTESEPD